jgi:hypothetical protein
VLSDTRPSSVVERVRSALARAFSLPRFTLRARLLVATAVVQALMLALLVASSASVMNAQLVERTRVHLEEQKALLAALLWEPLADDDRLRLQYLIERTRIEQHMAYLVLLDAEGELIGAAGWPPGRALPPAQTRPAPRGDEEVFHAHLDIRVDERHYGRVFFGL